MRDIGRDSLSTWAGIRIVPIMSVMKFVECVVKNWYNSGIEFEIRQQTTKNLTQLVGGKNRIPSLTCSKVTSVEGGIHLHAIYSLTVPVSTP